jgi:hypothetical protein
MPTAWQPPRKRRRSWPRRIARGALIGLLIIALALASVIAFAHTDRGREVIRRQAESILDGIIDGEVRIGSVHGSVLGDLEVRDVAITDPAGKTIVSARALAARFDLLPLVRQHVVVHAVSADEVVVTGIPATAGPKKDDGGGLGAWVIDVADARVRNAIVALPAGDVTTLFQGTVRADARIADQDIRAKARLDGTSFDPRLPAPTVAGADAEVAIRGETITAGGAAHVLMNGIRAEVWATPGNIEEPLAIAARVAVPGASAVASATLTPREPLRATGVLMVRGVDTRILVGPETTPVLADADLAFEATIHDTAAGIRGIEARAALVAARAVAEGKPLGATGTVHLADGRISSAITAVGPGATYAGVRGDVVLGTERILLENGRLVARSADLAAALPGGVRGAATAELAVAGVLMPEPDLAVKGTLTARNVRTPDIAVRDARVDLALEGLLAKPRGRGRAVARGVMIGADSAGDATVELASRPDGGFAVAARAAGGRRYAVDLAATVWPRAGFTGAKVALGRHSGVVDGLAWSGNGGTIDASAEAITASGVAVAVGGGRITADGTYARAGARTGDATGAVTVTNLDLARLQAFPPLAGAAGVVTAQARASRQNGALRAEVAARVQGARWNDSPPVDGTVDASVGPGQLTAAVDLRQDRIGGVKANLDVAAPRRVDDPAAWQKLRPDDIRRAEVVLERVDLGAAAELAGRDDVLGIASGSIALVAGKPAADLTIRQLSVAGIAGIDRPYDVDLAVTSSDDGRAATAALDIRGEIAARAVVDVNLPADPTQPKAWLAMGREAMTGAIVRVDGFDLASPVAARLGAPDLDGIVSVRADVGPAASSALLTVNVRGLRGGPLARSIDVAAQAQVDGARSRADLEITAAGTRVFAGWAEVGVGIAALERDAAGALASAPLKGELTVPRAPAPLLGSLAGRGDVTAGVVDATITLAGTTKVPRAQLTARASDAIAAGIRVPSALVDASFDGDRIEADVRIEQRRGGSLEAKAAFALSGKGGVQATVVADEFNLRPLGAVAPSSLSALAGRLDANFKVIGPAWTNAAITGELHVVDARLPIGGVIGVVRNARVDATIGADRKILLAASGEIGRGRIGINGDGDLVGMVPSKLVARANLIDVPITLETQTAEIDSRVALEMTRRGEQWRAKIDVTRSSVKVIDRGGERLLEADLPEDLLMIDPGAKPPGTAPRKLVRPPPGTTPGKAPAVPSRVAAAAAQQDDRAQLTRAPILVADINLSPTAVTSKELRSRFSGKLEVSVGRGDPRIEGQVRGEEGFVEILGRRYRILYASARFSGTPEPNLEIRIAHDFPEVTVYVDVSGTPGEPKVALSSEPAVYSENQLLSFVLGATPGAGADEAGQEVSNAGVGVAASLVSQKLLPYLNEIPGVDIDVLQFEQGNAERSSVLTVGKWITRKILLAYRARPGALENENRNEAQLEYWFNRSLVFEIYGGDIGAFGGDLLYILRR